MATNRAQVKWHVVRFVQEDTNDLVPENLFTDNTMTRVLWPPYAANKLQKALAKKINPSEDWIPYDVLCVTEEPIGEELHFCYLFYEI